MPFASTRTEWKQLDVTTKCSLKCTQVWNCTLKTVGIRIWFMHSSCAEETLSTLPAHSARSSESRLRSKSTRSAASGNQECLPYPGSWISCDRYRLSRQAAPQLLCSGPSMFSSKRPDRLVGVDKGFLWMCMALLVSFSTSRL